MIRAGLAGLALLFGAAPAPVAIVAPAAIPAEDTALLRAVLAELGSDYCVTEALGEAPFAGVRRDMAERAADEIELAALEKRAAKLPRDDAERERAVREQVGWGWTADSGKSLDLALLARITDAAVAVARRGDPTPLPPDADAVADLNTMDAQGVAPEPGATLQASGSATPADDALQAEADRLEALADAAVSPAGTPREHGRVERGWLAPGQRLAAGCPFPAASLSAVAREGDLAFISVGTVWAPLAGRGETWAMERTAQGWRRVAKRQDWIA